MDAQIQAIVDRIKDKAIMNGKDMVIADVEAVVAEMPALLDLAAATIPGQVDDLVIAALKPALMAGAEMLLAKLKA